MKTSSDAEARRILSLLPETLPEDVQAAMLRSVGDELGGGEFLLFRRESWCNSFDSEIGYPLYDEAEKPTWAAECVCGACGNRWHSGWADRYTIRFAQGEDGTLYPGIPDRAGMAVDVNENEAVDCPFCERRVVAVSRASLKNGRLRMPKGAVCVQAPAGYSSQWGSFNYVKYLLTDNSRACACARSILQ